MWLLVNDAPRHLRALVEMFNEINVVFMFVAQNLFLNLKKYKLYEM